MMAHALKKVLALTVAIAMLVAAGSGITAPVARALSVPSVTVLPNVVGERAKYTVEFTLGAGLEAGDEIWLYFPAGTSLPCTSCNPRILQTTVTVNGVYPILPSIGNNTTHIVQVYIPKALKAGQLVTLIVDASAGVRNPLTGGTYVLGVSTTKETNRVDSGKFGIGASRVSDVVVHPTDSAIVGKNTGYQVDVITGYGGALAAGSGTITLTFPEGTMVPADIPEDSGIAVNGTIARHVVANPTTRSITITAPVAVNAVDLLSIRLPSAVGLMNPDRKGEYTLFVHTSAEIGDVRSDVYIIEDAPAVATVVSVTPPAPEGEDMWYLHAPMVALVAQSNKEGELSTWYAVDDAPMAQYAQPFQMPDGIHTLRYMSKNAAAGIQEDVRTQQFKVEICAPVVTFSEGDDAILTRESTLTLHGNVSSCASGVASVEIAGQSVTISTLHAVTAKLLLTEGENDISVLARTNAGNSRLTTLKVTLDSVAPSISILSHKNWETVTTPSITVKGQAEEGATVAFEGKPMSGIAPDGSFQQTVALKPGQNVIAFTASDTAGNTRTASVIVIYGQAAATRTVILTVGSPAMLINGTAMAIDANPMVVPVIRSGRTLVPVRSLVQALGGTVTWNAATRAITIKLEDKIIELTIDNPAAMVNGKVVPIDADRTVTPVILSGGRTMIPLRFVSEQLGASVSWNAKTHEITIRR